MRVRHGIIALVAAALGAWVAVAAAQGGFGAGSSGTTFCSGYSDTVPCPSRPPKHAHGFGSGGAGGAAHHHHHRGAVGSSEGPEPGHGGQPRPAHGRPPNFTFSVRWGHGQSSGTGAVHGYSTHVLLPPGASASCLPHVVRRPNITARSQVARIHLRPPAIGWCDGRYRVTVTLNP